MVSKICLSNVTVILIQILLFYVSLHIFLGNMQVKNEAIGLKKVKYSLSIKLVLAPEILKRIRTIFAAAKYSFSTKQISGIVSSFVSIHNN